MKNNKKSQTNNKTAKNANAEKQITEEKVCNGTCRVMPSGLDRDIVMNTALGVSLMINLFFLIGAIVIGSDPAAAHAIGSAIYHM